MTKAQERKIDMIHREIMRDIKMYGNREIKTFETEENEYFVSLYAEVGTINDEGTLAEVFCRDKVHVFIGKRGGIRVPINKILKNGNYKHYYKEYTSFLSASLDQK